MAMISHKLHLPIKPSGSNFTLEDFNQDKMVNTALLSKKSLYEFSSLGKCLAVTRVNVCVMFGVLLGS